MKKVLAFVSSLLLLGAAAFADVSVKKLDDGNVEVTFFYANPRAGEVLVAGDFTNWADGALPMTKTDKGYTLTQVVPAGTVMKYKFISDGNWTEDMHEPDKIDDGFGGHNGLVDVDELVAAAAEAAGSTDGAAPATTSKKASIKFATWSMVGAQNKWSVTDDGLKEDSAGIGAKSYWKFSGNITPHVPFFAAIAVAENDSFDNIYSSTNKNVADNLKTLGLDLLTNPIDTLNGSASKLGEFVAGVETPYVNFTAGYNYGKLTPHTNVNWTTITDNWDAGYLGKGGFARFALGSEVSGLVSEITDGAVDGLEVVVGPNKTADRAGEQYGIFAIVDAKLFGNHYVDFQYNSAYGKDALTALKRENIMESDFILGYSAGFGPVTVKANGLVNFYGNYVHANGKTAMYSPASSDVGAVNAFSPIYDRMAANVNAFYSGDYVDATVGYKFRGKYANLMYNNNAVADSLGSKGTQTVWTSVTAYPLDFLTAGLNASVTTAWLKPSVESLAVYAKPTAEFYLGDFIDLDSAVDAYAEMSYAEGKFAFQEAGLHFGATLDNDYVPNVDVYYGYDANGETKAHSLIAKVDLPFGIAAQTGAVYRTAGSNPFGAFIGANKVINAKYKTILYTQFVYNMEAYNGFGDGQEALDLDGYTLDNDASGYAAARVALRFEF